MARHPRNGLVSTVPGGVGLFADLLCASSGL
jgi:hypothetical protein